MASLALVGVQDRAAAGLFLSLTLPVRLKFTDPATANNREKKTMNNNPIITIKGKPESRQQPTKNGPKTIYYQPATFENEQLRMNLDIEIDEVADAHEIGKKLEWDVNADLVPGQFGRIELARKKTLRPVDAAPKLKTA